MPGLRRNGTNPHALGNTNQSPWARPRFVLSVALLGIVALAGILLAATHGNNPAPSTPPASHASNPPDVPPASPPGSGPGSASHNDSPAANTTTCSLPPGNQAVPSTSPPPNSHWKLVGSMEAPTDPDTYGPQRTHGIWRTCFAHSPTGALYAAINFYAEDTAAPNLEVERRLLADGPLKNGTLRDDKNQPSIDVNGPLHVVGYAYAAYSPQTAALTIGFRLINGKLLSIPTTMIWQHGDWRVATPPKGQRVDPLPDLTSYVRWGAG